MTDRRAKGKPGSDATSGAERRMGERRDSQRLPLQVSVKIGDRAFEAYAADISIGGVYFEKQLPLSPGEVVQLRFSLPQFDKKLEVAAEVMEAVQGDASPSGTRVRFVELDLRTELLIARYLDEGALPC
jgi:Tfp pilus assembly protein PilZ